MMNPIIDDINYIDKTYYTFRDLLTLKLEDKETNDYMSLSATPLIIRTDFLGWRTPSLEVSNILNDEVTLELWEHLKSLNLDEYIGASDKELKLNDQTPQDEVNKCFGSFYRLFEAILMRTYPRYKRLKTIYKANEENLLNKLESITTNSANGSNTGTSTIDGSNTSTSSGSSTSKNDSTTTNHESGVDEMTKLGEQANNQVPQASIENPFDTKFANETIVTNNTDNSNYSKDSTSVVAATGSGTTTDTSSGSNKSTTTNTESSENNSSVNSSHDPMPIMERLDSIRQKWYSIVDEWSNEFDSLFIELI